MRLQLNKHASFIIARVCVSVCVSFTWLAILMGGPLGPPAKRGDMKDCKDSFINENMMTLQSSHNCGSEAVCVKTKSSMKH